MTLGTIVLVMMGIFVCLAILPQIFNTQHQLTNKLSQTNDTANLTALECYTAGEGQVNTSSANCNVSVTNAPSGWKIADCPLDTLVVKNSSGDALTLTTDYTVNLSTGVVAFKNSSGGANVSAYDPVYFDYNYCADGYNKDSGSRGIARTIGLFAVLAMVIFVGYYGLKNWMSK